MPGILSSVAQGSTFTCSATGRMWSRRLPNQKRGSPGSSLAIRSGSGPDSVPFRRTCLSKALDQASTPAKSIGKSGAHHFCWFDENLEREKLAKSYILDCFSRAGKEHGVKVCYLPIVRSKDGRLCHLEALAHWQDPKHGLLSPNVFVPALEEAHRISELDFYMLEEVCRRMQREVEAGKTPIPVSVNFCAEDFEQEGALEKTLGILEAYRIPVSAIVLPIPASTPSQRVWKQRDSLPFLPRQAASCSRAITSESPFPGRAALKRRPFAFPGRGQTVKEAQSGDNGDRETSVAIATAIL